MIRELVSFVSTPHVNALQKWHETEFF